MRYSRQQGFTLIEVLIASFILFISIAAITLIYRGAMLSSHKAQNSVSINGVMPLIVDQLHYTLKTQSNGKTTMSGKGAMASVNYEWQAKVIRTQAAQPQLIPEMSVSRKQPARFKLWQLKVDAVFADYHRQYQYVELTWDDLP